MLMRDKGRRLPKSVDVRSYNRPMKVAFLVPADESDHNNWILDAIFYEAYSRWGGARSLIIAYRDGKPLNNHYENWLSCLDPDVIYSYVELSTDSISRLNRLSLPIAFLRHDLDKINTWRDYIPHWSTFITPVPAISTLTSPYGNYPGWSQTPTPQIYITQHPENCDSRFLPDNFAVRLSTSSSTFSHHGVYETICYTPTEVPKNYIVGTYRCSSLAELVNKLAKKEVRSFSRLSSIHSEGIFLPNDREWSYFFHIIIGESVLDRINFWNIRHFSSGWSPNVTPSSLILSPSLIEDEQFCKAIGSYLNNHNYFGTSNGPPIVHVTSYSLDRNTCAALMKKLQGDRNTWNLLSISHNFSEIALPKRDKYEHYRPAAGVPVPSFKLNDSENVFAAKGPDHFKYLPPNFLHAKNGQWLVDLEIERHNDTSDVVNVYTDWKLPRRLEVLRAFTNNIGKINREGNLSLIPASDHDAPIFHEHDVNYTIQLRLPEDETVFRSLVLSSNRKDYYDFRQCLNRNKYYDIRLSDKGQNHRGVVSKFHNTLEAASVVFHK